MADSVKLPSPNVRVTLDNGDAWNVQTINADLVLWDRTRAKHKWPTLSDAPFLWLTFLSWSASKRNGNTALTYEQFEAQTVSIENLDSSDEPSEEITDAFPTLPALVPERALS